jgi:Cyclin
MQSQDFQMQGYPTQVVATQFPYAPAAAPILPPLRIGGAIDPFQRYPQQEQKKEEKPTGGVAQHLDYEMDVMTLFVAEMTQELVAPGTDPAPTFRKYVAQILSSTRLPSSTILLGLFYMSSRLKLVAESGQVDPSSRNVFQMLTTGLLLGSKFLDDNTFQNRSWAEVSSIPVQDLNKLELAWLEGFDWEIHGLMYDDDEGFFQWVDHWHIYEKKTKAAKVKEMQKLAPIETNLRRSYTVQHPELMSPDGPIPQQYQQTPQYDQQWGRPYMSEYSPPSAPHSGPATPEYYPNQWNYSQTPSAFGRQAWNSGSAYSAQQGLSSFQHTPTYQAYGYSQPAWVGHGPSCGCTLCAKHSEYYFNHGGYGIPAIG